MAVAEKSAQRANANAEEEPYPKEGYAWYVVAILMIVYIFSFVDRQVLAYLVGPIKADLGVSDTAMGLLGGTTFAIGRFVGAGAVVDADAGGRQFCYPQAITQLLWRRRSLAAD